MMISIGTTVKIKRPVHDHAGYEHQPGEMLIIEQSALEHTDHPIVMATPTDWTRHQITHRSLHQISLGGQYCFFAHDLHEATR